jgi:DNA-binding GntR family transcriptional regulator
MTDLATLLDHARLTDLERAIIRAAESGPRAGTSAELAEMFDVSPRSLFRALASLEAAGIVQRETLTGRHGSMVIRLNSDAVDKLKRLCHSLGREGERPGAEYTQVRPENEQAVRADRARLMTQKRARQAAALGNGFARAGGQG